MSTPDACALRARLCDCCGWVILPREEHRVPYLHYAAHLVCDPPEEVHRRWREAQVSAARDAAEVMGWDR